MSLISGFASRRVLARGFVLIGMGVALSYGCASDEPTGGLASGCTLNSDCSPPFVCMFQRCHAACKTSVDCPPGTRCLVSAAGGVCQLSQEADCSSSSVCVAPLACGPDNRCRSTCTGDKDCLSKQVCVAPGVCADSQELRDGGLTSDAGRAAGGASSGDAGAGGKVAASGGASSGGVAASGGANSGGKSGAQNGGSAGQTADASQDSATPGPDGGKPGCDSTWLASPPNWFGAAGGTDWRPELHDPRWAAAPLEQFAVTPGGADSVGGMFRTLVKGRTLYVLFESTKATALTFADFIYFGVTRGTGGLGAVAFRMTPDQATLPVKAPGAGVPRDPTLPVKTDAGYVDWYDTTNSSVAAPVWNVHPAEIPSWLGDLATWRGSPGAGWAVTFKVDLTAIGAAGDLRVFHGMTIDQGSGSTSTFATPVLPAAANSVNGETIIPVSPTDLCDDGDPDTLPTNPCWRNLPVGGVASGTAISTADIGVLRNSSATNQFDDCGARGVPCPTNGSSITNTVRVTVHGVPSLGVTAHAVRAQIRVTDASTPADPNAEWKTITPFPPDGVFIAEQRALTSDASWSWSYDAGSGDATIDYTCTAAANDYCPKLVNLAQRSQCLLVELGAGPSVGTGFSSFTRAAAFRDVEF